MAFGMVTSGMVKIEKEMTLHNKYLHSYIRENNATDKKKVGDTPEDHVHNFGYRGATHDVV